MAKSLYTPEWKAMVAQEYIDGMGTSADIASKHGICEQTVRRWAQRYKAQGMSAFARGEGITRYSAELKRKCVRLYLQGEMSVDEIVAAYNISHHSLVSNWIKLYNANKELTEYSPKSEVSMAELKRKTTFEERKEIVEYCLAHNCNYKKTASLYDISYSQVYYWVKKYNKSGAEGLVDKRGHHKSDNELDELERLRRENLRLKRKLEEKDMLAELLKKVQEFERM